MGHGAGGRVRERAAHLGVRYVPGTGYCGSRVPRTKNNHLYVQWRLLTNTRYLPPMLRVCAVPPGLGVSLENSFIIPAYQTGTTVDSWNNRVLFFSPRKHNYPHPSSCQVHSQRLPLALKPTASIIARCPSSGNSLFLKLSLLSAFARQRRDTQHINRGRCG